jgi:hypothetical protein
VIVIWGAATRQSTTAIGGVKITNNSYNFLVLLIFKQAWLAPNVFITILIMVSGAKGGWETQLFTLSIKNYLETIIVYSQNPFCFFNLGRRAG